MSKASNNPPVNTVGDHIVEYVYFARVDALNAERRGIKGVSARNSLGSKTGPHSQQGRLGPVSYTHLTLPTNREV